MKIIMYGASICKDCVAVKVALSTVKGIELEYHEITESTSNLKEFLKYRDTESVFREIKEAGKIGIPFFLLEDGTKTLDIQKYVDIMIEHDTIDDNVKNLSFQNSGDSCSLNGKGHC